MADHLGQFHPVSKPEVNGRQMAGEGFPLTSPVMAGLVPAIHVFVSAVH
jgi:hypothetical protein